MATGLLGGLPPGLRGMLAAEQMGQQRTQNQLGQLGGILSLQGAMQNQAIQQQGLLDKQEQRGRLAAFAAKLPEGERERFMVDPASYIKQMGEGKFSKVDPKDYTPDSVAKFATTGNHADLVPARKRSVLASGEVVDEWALTPGTRIDMTTPELAFRRDIQFPWQQQVDRANVANSSANVGIANANLFYNTGMGPLGGGGSLPRPLGTIPQPLQGMGGGAPSPAPSPRPAPTQPPLGVPPPRNAAPTAPQVIVPEGTAMTPPGGVPLSPKAQQELALEKAKKEAELKGKREYNMQGLDEALNRAESILTGQPDETGKRTADLPTGSWVGKGQDVFGEIFGFSRAGAPEAAGLKAIAGSLVAKMPRMEGPQSDKDVQNYREMAGQIGDDTLPRGTRMSALKEVRRLYSKYKDNPQGASDSAPASDRRNQPRIVVNW